MKELGSQKGTVIQGRKTQFLERAGGLTEPRNVRENPKEPGMSELAEGYI